MNEFNKYSGLFGASREAALWADLALAVSTGRLTATEATRMAEQSRAVNRL